MEEDKNMFAPDSHQQKLREHEVLREQREIYPFLLDQPSGKEIDEIMRPSIPSKREHGT